MYHQVSHLQGSHKPLETSCLNHKTSCYTEEIKLRVTVARSRSTGPSYATFLPSPLLRTKRERNTCPLKACLGSCLGWVNVPETEAPGTCAPCAEWACGGWLTCGSSECMVDGVAFSPSIETPSKPSARKSQSLKKPHAHKTSSHTMRQRCTYASPCDTLGLFTHAHGRNYTTGNVLHHTTGSAPPSYSHLCF
jgi:hypothetical protein